MTPKEDLQNFLADHPECHAISQSRVHMRVLGSIARGAMPFSDLSAYFQNIDSGDLMLIINSFVSAGLVSEFRAGKKLLYNITENGRGFLGKYKAASRAFGDVAL